MRKVKKFLATAMVLAMAMGMLTGCSSNSTNSTKEDSSGTVDTSTATTETTDTKQTKSDITITLLNSKGEIQEGLETLAEKYKQATGVTVEVQACGAGESPYTKVTTMYSAGNPPTMAILDTTDIVSLGEEKAVDLTNEKWVSECSDLVTKVNDKVYSFPFCVEGRGLIYNKTVIEKTLGKEFDPASINSYDSFKSLLEELVAAGMETPVVISKEDWSLAAHQLAYIYETFDGTTAGSADIIDQLKAGTLDLLTYDRFNEFIATFDLLASYNINRDDPLGALYEQDPIFLADGDAAFWFNGCWAWPNLKDAGAESGDEYGFLPYFLGNDTSDLTNTKIQAAPSKQLMIDNEVATEEQKQAALDFINWLVYDDAGQASLVNDLSLIPACGNNAYSPSDPLGISIKEHIASGNVFTASAITPSDHWSVLGAEMQKYLAKKCTKEELAKSIQDYWTARK
jgi:raffinose/stachyose/melibiose transport system substrate-binding protein